VLYERVSYQVGNRGTSPSGSEAETSLLSGRGAISHTREILQSTNRATRLALSQLSDAAWWKRTLGNLRPTQHAAAELDDRNMDLHQLGCHPFYESLHADCYVNKVIYSLEFTLCQCTWFTKQVVFLAINKVCWLINRDFSALTLLVWSSHHSPNLLILLLLLLLLQ